MLPRKSNGQRPTNVNQSRPRKSPRRCCCSGRLSGAYVGYVFRRNYNRLRLRLRGLLWRLDMHVGCLERMRLHRLSTSPGANADRSRLPIALNRRRSKCGNSKGNGLHQCRGPNLRRKSEPFHDGRSGAGIRQLPITVGTGGDNGTHTFAETCPPLMDCGPSPSNLSAPCTPPVASNLCHLSLGTIGLQSISAVEIAPPTSGPSATSGTQSGINVVPAGLLSRWSGNLDPPAPFTTGFGQWGQAHCGQLAWTQGQCLQGSAQDPGLAGATAFLSLDGTGAGNVYSTNGRFQITSTNTRYSGTHAAHFDVYQGDDWHGANDRNELTREGSPTSYSEGQEGWFYWSSFPDIVSFEALPGDNPFHTFTQWHHSGMCGSNPIGFQYTRQNVTSGTGSSSLYSFGLMVTQLYMDPGCNIPGDPGGSDICSRTTNVPPNRPASFNSTVRQIWAGPGTYPASGTPPQTFANHWNDFLLHIKFSTSPTIGFLELWYRGDPTQPLRQQPLSCSRGAPSSSSRCYLSTQYSYPADRSAWYLADVQGSNFDFCFQDAAHNWTYNRTQTDFIAQGLYRNKSLSGHEGMYHALMVQDGTWMAVAPTDAQGSACICANPWGDGSLVCHADSQPCSIVP